MTVFVALLRVIRVWRRPSTPNGMGKSTLVEPVLQRFGIRGTVRNWRSVTKLDELATQTS